MTEFNFKQFTSNDDAMLVELIEGCETKPEILKKLSILTSEVDRDKNVLLQRCFQLGLIDYTEFSEWLLSHRENGWRSDEIDFLVKNLNSSRALLAEALGRSNQSVSKQCFEMKLNNGGVDYPWSSHELIYLKRNVELMTVSQFQKKLGRCSVDIKHRMLKEGIASKNSFNRFTGRPPKNSPYKLVFV